MYRATHSLRGKPVTHLPLQGEETRQRQRQRGRKRVHVRGGKKTKGKEGANEGESAVHPFSCRGRCSKNAVVASTL